jgi:uncharacterized protein with von Willebrand factor type A (vWA) domain
LPQILTLLDKLRSPFAAQANAMVKDNPTFTPALQTLFLQRWRLSLVVQTTAFNQQLLEEEREQLLSEVQERMTLSGQLEPVLIENENAAGRLWDMSAGQIKRGDYQLIVKYGDFRRSSRNSCNWRNSWTLPGGKSVPKKMPQWKPSAWCANRLPCRSRLTGCIKVTISCVCCRLNWRRWALPNWSMSSTVGWEKQLLTYRLHGDAWQEKERPGDHQDFDEQPRGPFIVCVDTSGSMGGFNEQCAKAFAWR